MIDLNNQKQEFEQPKTGKFNQSFLNFHTLETVISTKSTKFDTHEHK